jgi:large subunit ribosomal protein L20
MARVKGTVASQRRRRGYIKAAKGQFGHRSRRYIQARRSVEKGLVYQFRDRKARKREFRRLWITRINAACKESGITYSRFIKGLIDAKISINRKMIAELAVQAPMAFKKLIKIAKEGASAETAVIKKEEPTPKTEKKTTKTNASSKK